MSRCAAENCHYKPLVKFIQTEHADRDGFCSEAQFLIEPGTTAAKIAFPEKIHGKEIPEEFKESFQSAVGEAFQFVCENTGLTRRKPTPKQFRYMKWRLPTMPAMEASCDGYKFYFQIKEVGDVMNNRTLLILVGSFCGHRYEKD